MYRIYAKFPGYSRFLPLNWARGLPVVNLIHATLFTEIEAFQAIQEAISINPEIQFEMRKA